MRKIDVINQKINRLLILEEFVYKEPSGRSRIKLKCKCDCGNICYIDKYKVWNRITKSCGCLQKEMWKELGNKKKKPYGEACINEVYYAYKKGAKLRGYEFNINKKYFLEIITKPCIYCGNKLTQTRIKKGANGNFKFTGIDRYDNSKGYIKGNCVPCCKICNRLKSNLSIKDFENKIEMIMKRKDIWSKKI